MDPDESIEGQEQVPDKEGEHPGVEAGLTGGGTDNEGMPVRYATTGSHPAMIALAVVLVIILALAVAAYGTLETDIGLPPVPGAIYPFTTTYSAVIPAGQQVTVAGVPFVVLNAGGTLQAAIDGTPEKLVPGEPYTIARGTARESSLGIVLSETGYQVDAVYQGAEGTSADLSLVIMTTQKASSRLVKALLPTGVEITPG
jgi:hypothetical protein